MLIGSAPTTLTNETQAGGTTSSPGALASHPGLKRGVIVQCDIGSSNAITINSSIVLQPGDREFFPVANTNQISWGTAGSATVNFWCI